MIDTIVNALQLVCEQPRGFLFMLVFSVLLGAFLIYLILALFLHRSDRKELERIALEKQVDVI